MTMPQPGQCPFTKQACIYDRCELYQNIPVAAPGPLVGSARTGSVAGCSFNLAAVFLARLLVGVTTSPQVRRQ
jgi:hypothetical protein